MAKATNNSNASVLIGINVNKIPNMISAITKYQEEITKATAIGMDKKNIDKYLKGENVKRELHTYMAQLDTEVNDMIKSLDKLKTNLQNTKSAYDQQDNNAAAKIAGYTAKLKS